MERSFAIARLFAQTAVTFTERTELFDGLEACSRELGFRYFAMLHHADVDFIRGKFVNIHNYPAGWAEQFFHERLYLYDPVLQASVTTNVGFSWDRLRDFIPLSGKQAWILQAARRAGIGNGFTVPANIPGEAHGSCSFACEGNQLFSDEILLAAQLVGSFAFQAARRICCAACPLRKHAVVLTPRQRECVELVAQGKTDWAIGRILGLQEDSVTKTINAARQRYNVANRTELVVAALFDGQISFNVIRQWQYS